LIYVHLPFCHSRCIYCNFFATASKAGRAGFENLILSEIEQRRDFLGYEPISSIYFGGGTPSLLGVEQLQTILDRLRMTFNVEQDAEITLEANPEDISPDRCTAWKDMGFNRLSMGVQSFRDADLKWLGRIHSAARSRIGIETALGSGLSEISIDLIYGIPGQSLSDWQENLNIFASYSLPHLSSYWLTVEPATPLERLLRSGKKVQAPEAEGEAHFFALMDWASAHGYEHYEISNLCLPGHYSRHNSSYWKGKPYLGLGPSAHSFKPGYRCWNPSSLEGYKQQLSTGSLPEGSELLSRKEQFNEYVMLGLRTQWGINLHELGLQFGDGARSHAERMARPLIAQEMILLDKESIRLATHAKLRADGIASSLFMDTD
jgi:oxygen-independent coproporphyrinogen III oxidase